jgi:hypothetical protein
MDVLTASTVAPAAPAGPAAPTTSAWYTVENAMACEVIQRLWKIPSDCEIIDEQEETDEIGPVTNLFLHVTYRPKSAPEGSPGICNWAHVLLPVGTGKSISHCGPQAGALVDIDLSMSEA